MNPPPNFPLSPARSQTPGIAIASLVFGILGFICFGPLGSIPAIICGHITKKRIKLSGGAMTGDGLALAGLILGYVGLGIFIVIFPLMMAIAVPNFVKARNTAQTNGCINNLRVIDGAKQQWALNEKRGSQDIPAPGDLTPYLGKSFESLQCPGGGQYSINVASEDPTCSKPNHQLIGP